MKPSSEPSYFFVELLNSCPEVINPAIRKIILKVERIQIILLRNRKGGATRRDWFEAARILLSLSRKELIYLLLSLGQNEFPSIFPYAIRFIERKKTKYDRVRSKALTDASKKDKKIADQDAAVALVAKHKAETGESIDQIIAEHGRHSQSKIQKDYNAGRPRADERGYALLWHPNRMVPPEIIPIEPRRRGRPKGAKNKK
jgi:hypothetical protein